MSERLTDEERDALDYLVRMASGHDYADGLRISEAEDVLIHALTSGRAAEREVDA